MKILRVGQKKNYPKPTIFGLNFFRWGARGVGPNPMDFSGEESAGPCTLYNTL